MPAEPAAGDPGVHAVTGPHSYTGRYIARRLQQRGTAVRGLVRLPVDGGQATDCRQLQFADQQRLAADLRGVDVLYNTYWIRCPRDGMTFDRAVENTRILAEAAAIAGVGRIVHLSVSNPALNSPFAYFRGKAAAEDAIRSTNVPVSIIRPTLVFGREDVLINNVAWLLRRLHAFATPGNSPCRVQPVFVGDVADIALAESAMQGERTLDAAGPEVLTFVELVHAIARSMHVRALIAKAPTAAVRLAGSVLSGLLHDVLITGEEIGALAAETLISAEPPLAPTPITQWLTTHGKALGCAYTSETARHWARVAMAPPLAPRAVVEPMTRR